MNSAYSNIWQPPYHVFGVNSEPDFSITGSLEAHSASTSIASTFQYNQPAAQQNLGSFVAPTSGPVCHVDNRLVSTIRNNSLRTGCDSSRKDGSAVSFARNRRKAQNRAAQRAFRERKERHARDLEEKVSALEAAVRSLKLEKELLSLALQYILSENKILRVATTSNASSPYHPKLIDQWSTSRHQVHESSSENNSIPVSTDS